MTKALKTPKNETGISENGPAVTKTSRATPF